MDEKPVAGPNALPRRRDAAKDLVHPQTLKGGFALTPQPHWQVSALAGAQAGLAAAIALPLVYLSPFSHLLGFAALGTLVAVFGRFAPPMRRNAILFWCLVTQVLSVFFMSTLAWSGAPEYILLAALALSCGVLFFITMSGKFGPPGALLFVFAVGAAMNRAESFAQVLERTAAVLAVGLFSWLVCYLTEYFRNARSRTHPFPIEPTRPLANRLRASYGMALGALVAVIAAKLVGAAHPSWVALGAMAVMTGAQLHISMHKAAQRLLGTVIGSILAWAVIGFDPNIFTLIAIIVALQIGTEAIIGFNYGIGQILVTPMALLMTYIASPQSEGSAMALERMLDTLIGATIGIFVSVILSTVSDRKHLAAYKARNANER